MEGEFNLCAAQRQKLRDDVPKLGLSATIAGRQVLELGKATLTLAEQGLKRRRRVDTGGHDETRYLQPLQEFVTRGITPAEELLEKFHGPWAGRVEPVFQEYAY